MRHLNNTTLGVVGFVDLNQVTSATLSVDGTVGVTPVDLIPLAQHNASGGGNNPGSEGRLRGLWSATLISPGSFTGGMMVVADATSANQNCQETVDVIIPPPGWRIEIETIDPVVGANPDIDGLDRVVVRFQSGDGSLPTLALSRYLYNSGQPGLAGLWQTMDTFTAQAEGNAFKNIVADLVDPGENLYRVTVDGQPQVEDVDGFYAVHVAEELVTEEFYQRRQALVFRDIVRETLASNQAFAVFSDQLIIAMGTAESGTENSIFDNTVLNTRTGDFDGIMQITCSSGKKGATQLNQDTVTCDESPPDYEAIAQSIRYNVGDALLYLNETFQVANDQTSDRPQRNCYWISDQNGMIDTLITAVVYYNGECTYPELYANGQGNPHYLNDIARQLDPQPEAPSKLPDSMTVAQFLADTDYTADPNLVQRLDHGQMVVDNQVASQ